MNDRHAQGRDMLNGRCEYFALCVNRADGYVLHPILGRVPTCRRCAGKFDLPLVTEEQTC